jgi:manganese efflux pump family protein
VTDHRSGRDEAPPVPVNSENDPNCGPTTVPSVLGLFLVAVSLGASNFAASIGIGLAGVDNRTRLRVAVVFGFFEAAMPLIGLGLGQRVSHELGSAGHEIGAGLLIAVGVYTAVMGLRPDHDGRPRAHRSGRLVLTGLALSIDNLVVGFALGSLHIEFAVAAAVIAVFSVGMSLVGLEIGNRVGTSVETRSEVLGGVVLVGVGIAVAVGLLG